MLTTRWKGRVDGITQVDEDTNSSHIITMSIVLETLTTHTPIIAGHSLRMGFGEDIQWEMIMEPTQIMSIICTNTSSKDIYIYSRQSNLVSNTHTHTTIILQGHWKKLAEIMDEIELRCHRVVVLPLPIDTTSLRLIDRSFPFTIITVDTNLATVVVGDAHFVLFGYKKSS